MCYNIITMRNQIIPTKALFLLLSALVSFPLAPDQREENINFFLILDKSRSMVQEIGEVKRYVNDFLFEAFLIPGDQVTIISFYGRTELLFSGILANREAKTPLRTMVEAITADGRYTDIGNALDRLKKTLEETPPIGNTHNYLLLITDGIQEAPLESPYYSPDGSFNHRFLENTKTIQKQGWKIQILGVGGDSTAKEIAEELSGVYAEVSGEITAEKLDKATSQIYGMIRPSSEPILSPADASGAALFTINLASTGYAVEKIVEINEVRFEPVGGERYQVLDAAERRSFSIALPPEGGNTLTLPLSFSEIPGPESLEGSLSLNFSGEVPITPAVFPVTLKRPPVETSQGLPTPWIIGSMAVALILFFPSLATFSQRTERSFPIG